MSDLNERIARLSASKRRLLEQRLKEQRAAGRKTQGIPRRVPGEPAALAYAQRRQWFLQQLEPDQPGFNKSNAVRILGALDVAALERALEALVDRHEILRTVYTCPEYEPAQILLKPWSFSLPVIDLQEVSKDGQDDELERRIREETYRPFDLTRDLVFRAVLFRLAPQDHVLLRVSHHIGSDRWSVGIMDRELSQLYKAYHKGEPSPLASLPIQYADYAVWQREQLRGEALEKQLAYWLDRLQGAPGLLRLPTDKPRQDDKASWGGLRSALIPRELAETIKGFSQQNGVTPFMTYLAVFSLLLSRYSGQDDLLVGVPIAGRTRAETEGLIGLFINTLVFRSDLSGNPPFLEFLARIRQTALGAYAHQELPFEKLVEELEPDRDLHYTPLFQVMFDFMNTPGRPLELWDLEVTPVRQRDRPALFDLSLDMVPESGGYRATFEYNRDLFEESTIQRMLGHYLQLLRGILDTPEKALGALSLTTPQERQLMLVDWNQTGVELPEEATLAGLFAAQAARTPEAIALVQPDHQQLTYKQLNEQSNRLAHFLRRQGVEPGDLIGLRLERSILQVVALLGIMKAGAAYVPIDPTYPRNRQAYLLADARPAILLTSRELSAGVLDTGTKVIYLEEDWELISRERPDDPGPLPGGDAPLYVLYTSGSTGRPKGVLVGQRAAFNFVLYASQYFEMQPLDRVLQFASLNFDTAVEELFPALLTGARVVLRPSELFPDFGSFHEFIERHGLTILDLPTTYWHAWVAALEHTPRSLHPSVRLVIVGGEQALPERLLSWRSLVGKQVRWVNTYGPTEATVVSTVFEPGDDWGDSEAELLPIGRPIANAQVYLLDQALEPVPVGVPGELCIGGEGLAQGYLNHDEFSAERFIPNPFYQGEDEPLPLADNYPPPPGKGSGSSRLFRTGDLARYLPDGNLIYLGRADRQVKVRGMRVEPGEVENALGQHKTVEACAVIPWTDPSGNQQLVAYVVPARDSSPSPSGLRGHLAERLPTHMIPAGFLFLEALPHTPSGKVDRNSLPRPDKYLFKGEVRPAMPRTPVEQVLAGIWATVLDIESAGIHDNFFELGGHSLLAIQLASRCAEALRVKLPLREIFEAPTVAGMAVRLSRLEPEQGWLDRAARHFLHVARLSESEAQALLDELERPSGAQRESSG